MMVSKIAVMALVAIIAVPILLGYGMNFTETTETGYRLAEGDVRNLTPYLENGNTGSAYTYAHSDIVTMNSIFQSGSGSNMQPYYNGTFSTASAIPRFQYTVKDANYDAEDIVVTDYENYYIEFKNASVVTVALYDQDGNLIQTYTGVLSVEIIHDTNTGNYWKVLRKGGVDTIIPSGQYQNVSKIRIWTSGYTTDYYYSYIWAEGSGHDNDSYIDLSKGYYYWQTAKDNSSGQWPSIRLPNYTRQFTMTMNLDSITDANYTLHLNVAPLSIYHSTIPYTEIPIKLEKTTVGSTVTWTLTNEFDSSEEVTELFIDPSISDNTYQFTIRPDCMYDETTNKYYLAVNVTAAYVGGWPTLIGLANQYITYDLYYVMRDDPRFIYNSPLLDDDLTYYSLYMYANNGERTPTIRLDDALYRAFEFNTITDRTFDPVSYTYYPHTNPVTTIEVLNKYGTSLTFGGHVYAINKGNITINSHSISAKKLVFSSVINESGTYDNAINNTVVSTTAKPSDITLGGSWSASVSVSKMESYTYTKTEWIPGQFAWDGIDDNFLMAGLLTSLGVFIALGIHSRRSRSSVWPLMLVAGGAAFLFLIMM